MDRQSHSHESTSKNTNKQQTIATSSQTNTSISLSLDPYGVPFEVGGQECLNDEISMMSYSILKGPSGSFESSTQERWMTRGLGPSPSTEKEVNEDGDDDFTRVSI